MKYEINDKVRVKETGEVGVVAEAEYNIYYVGLCKYSTKYSTKYYIKYYIWYTESDLTPYTKTIRDIEVDDVLVKDGREYHVLMRSGELVVTGVKEDYGYKASFPMTIDELVHFGFTLKDTGVEDAVEEMTMQEVCAALGKVIKIKK